MKKILSDKRLWSIFWAVAAGICMIVIFMMSHQPAEESAEMSGKITECLVEIGVAKSDAENIESDVRECAHMIEFFGLSFCLGMFLHVRMGRLSIKNIITVLIICMLYAVSDEIHQLFMDGRACQITDVFMDTFGASLALLLLVIFEMLKGLVVRKRQ